MASQEDFELARRAAFRDDVDLIEASGAMIRSCIDVDRSTGQQISDDDQAARVSFTQQHVESVLDHPGEIVVTHRSEVDDERSWEYFGLIVPDADRPFKGYVYPDTKKDDVSSTYGLRLTPTSVGTYPMQIPGSRDVVFDNDTASHQPFIHMGPGCRPEEYIADEIYKHSIAGSNHEIAVGNDAVGDMFNRLGSETNIDREKLFAVLFHIGWLATDMSAPLPTYSGFEAEAARFNARLELAQRKFAIITQYRNLQTELTKVSEDERHDEAEGLLGRRSYVPYDRVNFDVTGTFDGVTAELRRGNEKYYVEDSSINSVAKSIAKWVGIIKRMEPLT